MANNIKVEKNTIHRWAQIIHISLMEKNGY